MRSTGGMRVSVLGFGIAVLALLASPQAGTAQSLDVVGQATALRATVTGLLGSTTTVLGSTGWLTDEADARAASLMSGSIPSVGGAEVLEASTISSVLGWAPDDAVSSAASLANLALTVAGVGITADFVMSEAYATVDGVREGLFSVQGLTVGGVPITVSGAENQTVALGAVTLVINQVQQSASGITVNALRITSAAGLVDVVVTSATAGIQQ